MAQFMIDISIPAVPTSEFLALIPAQRAHVDELINQGTVNAYSLSLDRLKLWILLTAEDKKEVVEILRGFPLYRYFEVAIHPLLFHNSPARTLPKVYLN